MGGASHCMSLWQKLSKGARNERGMLDDGPSRTAEQKRIEVITNSDQEWGHIDIITIRVGSTVADDCHLFLS